MDRDNTFTRESKLVAVRLPRSLREQARAKARSNDLTFSQLMRRAIRRELGLPMPDAERA